MSEASESVKGKLTRVNIPMQLTILIPVDIPFELVEDGSQRECDGVSSIDGVKNQDALNAALEAVTTTPAFTGGEDSMSALEWLIAAGHEIEKMYPDCKAFYSPCGGIVGEKRI